MARPLLFTAELQARATQLAGLGLSRCKIAERLGVSPQTLRRALERDAQFRESLLEQAARYKAGRGAAGAATGDLLRLLVTDLKERFAGAPGA